MRKKCLFFFFISNEMSESSSSFVDECQQAWSPMQVFFVARGYRGPREVRDCKAMHKLFHSI